ncbi:MAG: SPOR domain-containing protein [bacterium]|nr:MAG: SPOR domain-containing protein [bacterium]
MARKSAKPKELVRLTPFQFSLSVSIIVLLMAGAGLAGYLYGLREGGREQEEAVGQGSLQTPDSARTMEEKADTLSPVTFYQTLTEQRRQAADTPPPKAAPVKPEPRERSGGEGLPLMLQVASYRSSEAAHKLLEGLSSDGYSGTVMRVDLGDRGVWYRVKLGPYHGEEEAGRVLAALEKERSLKGFIAR